ncbi:MAG: hypothetical protein Q8Q80_13270 [Methyloversatilis sp.]|uniref:hypothetical protein n=1 Tax=Methyloversatilis sp. TaxID=2569862 RepID=UPI0027331431|nr:hypothetical protein [Methyloversatilis sp.]MDP3873622.1 hypothetical protein [Methyloversatilis sp.]
MFASLARTPDSLGTFGLVFWGGVLLALLIAVGVLIVIEQRMFRARGKGGGALFVRLCSLPILALTVVAVLFAARAVSGMEGLAVFYAALLTLAPLLWFGLHGLAGWLASPRLGRGESAWLAVSGLLMLLSPVGIISALQMPYFHLVRLIDGARVAATDQRPLPHDVRPVLRFRLAAVGGGTGDLLVQSLRAPAGVTVERVEAMSGGHWADTATQMHAYMCRNGADLHFAWRPGTALPRLRLFWRDASGTALTEFQPADPVVLPPAADFVPRWRGNGVDLPAPLPRDLVTVSDQKDAGGYFRALPVSLDRAHDCLLSGDRLAVAPSGDAASALRISVDLAATDRGLRAEYAKPDPRDRNARAL